MFLVYLVEYRLDLVVFAALIAGGAWAGRRIARRRGVSLALPLAAHGALGVIVLAGGALAEWAGRLQRDTLVETFAAFGPTYALELTQLGHSRIKLDTPADDPTYLALIEREREWLRVNPLIADLYTFRRDAEGRMRLIVDSETDYNRDGHIDGEREQRTPIGEIYREATPRFFAALDGRPVFETSFVSDRWGVWVSSLCPIYGPDGRVEAALGIDYPAAHWVTAIAAKRGLVLVTALFLVAILVSSVTWVSLLRAEIRERREAEHALAAAKENADAANHAKGNFLAVMSHEIRNPLTAIVGYASMLRETPLDSTQHRYLGTMYQGATTLLDLLNNVLDYTKLEEGRLQLEAVEFQPADLVAEVLDLLRGRAEAKGIALVFIDELEPGATFVADPTRLRQILTNLVSNGIKFTSAGSVTVRARARPAAEGTTEATVIFAVTDTGPGIPPEKIPRLFHDFVQADASTARRYGGTGLGLAICRRVVDFMGGEIGVTSTVGQGATFTFAVPATARPAQAVPLRPSFTPEVAANDDPPRLLVVDDNAVNREVMQMLLAPSGYVIDLAASGRAALEFVREHHYAAILLDLHMPEMDGLTVARTIRAGEAHRRHTPIIAVTAHMGVDVKASCVAAGMDDFLTKPIERARLLASLARVRELAAA